MTQPQDSPREAILPDVEVWLEALGPLLSQKPNPALGVMRPFAGAVFLVHQSSSGNASPPFRDISGYSVPLRMAMYTSSLLLQENFSHLLPDDLQVELFYLLILTCELANDQIDMLEDNKLFQSHQDIDTLSEVRQFLQDVHEIIGNAAKNAASWRDPVSGKQSPVDSSTAMQSLIRKLIDSSGTNTPTSYYTSKALSGLLQALVSTHGWQSEGSEEWLSKLDIFKTSTANVLGATAILVGLEDSLRSSKLINTLCNRIVSDVAGAKAQSENTLGLMVLLNSVLGIYDDEDLPVANNRLVFAIKQILSWTEDLAATDSKLASEVCRALQKLLPAIKDVYGSYWETTFDFCTSIWESSRDGSLPNERLPMIGMSLKLFSILQNLVDDANDDLKEAYEASLQSVCDGLVSLLKHERSKETQPLEFVDSLLSRLVVKIPSDRIKDLSEFYPLLASEFQMIQSAAFDVLQKALPKVQQELSVNVLLEETSKSATF